MSGVISGLGLVSNRHILPRELRENPYSSLKQLENGSDTMKFSSTTELNTASTLDLKAPLIHHVTSRN